MIDRRGFVAAIAATPLAAVAQRVLAQTPAASPEAAKMNVLFDAIMQGDLRRHPGQATALGLDKGVLAWTKGALSEVSPQACENDIAVNRSRLAALHSVNRAALQGMDGVNYDVVDFNLTVQDEAARFPWFGAPYVLSQLTGAYVGTPDFLDNRHTVETRQDADDYLSRLNAFADQMDGELELARHDVALGVIPPDFILDKALIQMRDLQSADADKSSLVQSLARRVREKNIPGDYEAEAGRLWEGAVRPALTRQIDYLQSLRPTANHDAGVWKLKDGADYYGLALKQATTSTIGAEEVHKTGLELVASHQAQIDQIMRKQGLTGGTVGERLRALYTDPKRQYPNTDDGKERLIADLNLKIQAVTAKLPAWFGVLPTARLEIRRVPKATEAGAPGGYYSPPPIDNSRPGIYWINLRDTAEVPKWTLPTLTFHEGIPGHHLQGSIANHANLPLIRKAIWLSGYGEGWALYAEQLAVEMGMYADDPLGHIGQLHDSMFRAVRLVVDSGLHAQRWSREQAIRYYVENLGDQEASAVTEVERYCVWPGQACSYMVGKLTWLKLRAQARAALGPKFDIRKFHDAGLLCGPTPLPVLGRVIGDYQKSA